MKFAVSLAALLVAVSAHANSEPAAAAPKGDPKAAESIVNAVCAGCHNADGNSVAPTNPKLAGLNAEYIAKQLHDFKSGDRKNAIMNGMAAPLSDSDILNLAAYFSANERKPGTAKDKELALAGEKIFRGGVMGAGVPACASCHGAHGQGIPVQFPRLQGQHGDYIYAQLNSFRLGERSNDAAKMMRTIAQRMTDADMKAVSAYIQGLR